MLEEAYRYYERERLAYMDKNNPSFVGRYDQDDVLVMVADLLKGDEALRRRWGGKFKFILVDEVQDTSPVQFEIVEALMQGGGHQNVMLVGDLRQSIYGFRGAFPQYIQNFTDTFNARVINLGINYRSKPEVVTVANRIARAMTDIDERFRSDMIAGKS
jgi:DNA helicase-2/ATP-dependent DNA helicase PcrA